MAETTSLSPILLRAPMIDRQTLLVTRPWSSWFLAAFERMGGVSAPANGTLAADLAALAAALTALTARVDAHDAALDALDTRLTAAEATLETHGTRLTALETLTTDHETRLDGIDTSLTALDGRTDVLEATDITLDTRLDTLEAKHTAVGALTALTGGSGGTANTVVEPVPTLGATPATVQVLRDDLQNNWYGPLCNDLADLQTFANALRDALD